jgi:hypothetical protein
VLLSEIGQEVQPAPVGKGDVEEDHIGPEGVHRGQDLSAITNGAQHHVLWLEERLQPRADDLVVVDDEDARAFRRHRAPTLLGP